MVGKSLFKKMEVWEAKGQYENNFLEKLGSQCSEN